jgi:hypothetical protein
MSKIMAGVFLGVFVSALFYEIFSRQNPELAEKVSKKFKEKFNTSPEPEGAGKN